MGKNQPLGLSEDEKNKLSIGLLREWWLIATQALVDEAGTEVTLANLRPYFIHTGMAGAHNIPVILGWSSERVASADVMTPVYHIIFDADGSLMHPLPDGSMEWISTGCATRGICQEACLCLCQYTGIGYFGEIAPDQEYLLDRSLSFGDQECRWLMKRKVSQRGHGQSPFYLETWKGEQLSIELNRYLAFSVIGEAWVNAVRSLSDVVGSGRALELLVHGIRSSGIALGLRLSSQSGASADAIDAPLRAVRLVMDLHNMKGRSEKGEGDSTCMEVHECPFSTSPSEICLEYEAFFSGMCEAINPAYEFACDRMMTKGDTTCHWMIRKKGEPSKDKSKEQDSLDDPIKRLTNKFIDGEITEEELEKKVAHLRKLGLVK